MFPAVLSSVAAAVDCIATGGSLPDNGLNRGIPGQRGGRQKRVQYCLTGVYALPRDRMTLNMNTSTEKAPV